MYSLSLKDVRGKFIEKKAFYLLSMFFTLEFKKKFFGLIVVQR